MHIWNINVEAGDSGIHHSEQISLDKFPLQG